jgi:hypothetical protein
MGGDTEVAQAGLPPIPPGFEIEKKPAAVAREKTALPPIPPGFQIETKPPAQPVAATPAAPVQRREAFGPPMAAAFPDAKPGSYTTKLAPNEEPRFQQWVKANRVPWQDTPDADYDMRGYWKAKFSGDPIAKQAANLHFPDPWKTPYHHTFSNESKYATADAPRWHKYDRGYRLIDKRGRIIADEPDETPGTQPPAASLQGAPHGPGRAPIQRREPFGPPAPGMLERTERALFGPTTVAGQLAHPVGRTKQTLTGRSKEERQRALERPSPVFADLRKLELEGAFPGQSTAAKAARGAVKGAESGLTGLTSPENVALMVGTAGFAELPAVSALISAGFSAQMLHAAYEKYPELRKKIEAGDVEGAAETAVDMGVDTLFGIGSLKHTAGGIGRVAERVGERLAEPPSKPKPKVYEGSAAGLSFPREATEGDQLPPKEAYPAVFQAAKLRYRVLRAQGVKLQEAANRVKEEFPILFGRKPVPTEETPAGEAPKSDAEALSDAAKQIRERLEEIIPSVEPPAPPGEGEPGLEPTAAEEEQPPAEAGAAPPAEKPPEPPSAEKEPAKEEKPPEPPKAEEPAKAPEPKPEPPVPGKKETPQAVLDRLKAADATKLSPEEHKDLAKAYVAAAKAATPEVKEKLTDAFTALDDAFKKAQKAPAATGEPAKPEPKEPKGKTPTAIVKYLDEATAAVSSLTPERFNEIVKTGIAATNKAYRRAWQAAGRLAGGASGSEEGSAQATGRGSRCAEGSACACRRGTGRSRT